ncbi:hypothetical protein NDU88_002490 [Pleurodeles waltl]|uniref:Uncharacterized protein n=1 Tax=Pleurodeles waltl TaxID=8319 RepID=A0AAV7UYM5_PLEWA|nr:hypothetical protein NDU88_002490 [Pleurodeles waltl]
MQANSLARVTTMGHYNGHVSVPPAQTSYDPGMLDICCITGPRLLHTMVPHPGHRNHSASEEHTHANSDLRRLTSRERRSLPAAPSHSTAAQNKLFTAGHPGPCSSPSSNVAPKSQSQADHRCRKKQSAPPTTMQRGEPGYTAPSHRTTLPGAPMGTRICPQGSPGEPRHQRRVLTGKKVRLGRPSKGLPRTLSRKSPYKMCDEGGAHQRGCDEYD